MGLRILTNTGAMVAQRALSKTTAEQAKHYQRLSSGERITNAGDDAAGLSISETLKAQIRSLARAEQNANDGISMVQVAEGGLSEISNILIRLRELSIQAASDTVGDRERGFINQEFKSLVSEVDRIANVTSFNGNQLLNGKSDKDELVIQVGASNKPADRIAFRIADNNVQAKELKIDDLDATTIEGARSSLDVIDNALGQLNSTRAGLGAMQNKLISTTNNLQIARENFSQARSRVADADIADEVTQLVRANILQSAGIAVLAQANSAPKQALSLL